jgi:hypothetical protein
LYVVECDRKCISGGEELRNRKIRALRNVTQGPVLGWIVCNGVSKGNGREIWKYIRFSLCCICHLRDTGLKGRLLRKEIDCTARRGLTVLPLMSRNVYNGTHRDICVIH